MNDRIEELIIAYLHRGSTPEQERELFEACRSNPETANLLRQHLVMSLKLRQLRDSTVVPPEVRNELLLRINQLPPIPDAAEPPRRRAWMLPARFGLQHMAVAVAATAAIVFAVFQYAPFAGGGEPGTAVATRLVPDTVLVATRDTVVQTQTVRVPVYIARTLPREGSNDGAPAGDAGAQPGENLARSAPNAPGTDAPAGQTVPGGQQPSQQNPPAPPAVDRAEDASPALADNSVQETPSYLKQYNDMVLSLEKVHLSSSDRVRN